jgi:hypothetical protein
MKQKIIELTDYFQNSYLPSVLWWEKNEDDHASPNISLEFLQAT